MRRQSAGRSTTSLTLLLCAVLTAAGCGSKTVNDVLADPGRYRDKEVSVSGEVTESMGVLGRGFFKVQDGTGSLWVSTTRGLPRKGARVSTSGTVRDFATVDQFINRESVPEVVRKAIGNGLVLVERDRRAQ